MKKTQEMSNGAIRSSVSINKIKKISMINEEKLTATALISLSCPGNVCLHIPSRISHSFADASHAPEINVLISGERERDITSPVCPVKDVHCCPVSISHNALKILYLKYFSGKRENK